MNQVKRIVGLAFWLIRQRKAEGVSWRDLYLALGVIILVVLALAALAAIGLSQLL